MSVSSPSLTPFNLGEVHLNLLSENPAPPQFTGAVLCGVSFEKTELRRADFTRADLRNANLRNADLREAVFDGTDLSGSDFSRADLTGLSLRKSTLGPTTKGFAEALEKVAKPDPSYSAPYRPVVRRTDLERDLGPSC
ncbi:MAG: pentapeptide repeat-containing protein [Bryobacterales bacterium]|nr:pentapeptide repeat-containing protein [Bryobacterales bacterium]